MKIKLISSSIPYGFVPAPDAEVEQHFTLTQEGRAEFTSYIYGTGSEYEKSSSVQLFIARETAAIILFQIEKYFSRGYDSPYMSDSGAWDLEMTRSDGETVCFMGSVSSVDEGLCEISDNIRTLLNMPELFLFDGRSIRKLIDKISVSYRRIRKPPSEPQQIEENMQRTVSEDSESFVLNRECGSLEHFIKSSEGYQTEQRIISDKMIPRLLNILSDIPFWENIEGNPPDTIFDPHETREYSLTIDFHDGETRMLKGTFDKRGLPKRFPEMAEYLHVYLTYCTQSEVLDPHIFAKVWRKKSDYIFCNVVFNDWGRTYCYLTDNAEIKEGDYVVVPAGKDNHETIVRVDSVEYLPPENAPYPMDRIKRIIRKCTNEELEKMENENRLYIK